MKIKEKLSVVSDYGRVIPVSDRKVVHVAVGDRDHTDVVGDYAERGDYAELSDITRPIPKR